MMSLNGGYAMIKYNSTQEELQIAYRSKRPVLFYDENQRAHWAVIEETATESIDEETQEPITIYEYSYRLIDEASSVIANPTLSGNEATLNGLEIDGTKYKVGGSGGSEVHLYMHSILGGQNERFILYTNDNTPFTTSTVKEYIYNNISRISITGTYDDNNYEYFWHSLGVSGSSRSISKIGFYNNNGVLSKYSQHEFILSSDKVTQIF